MTEGTTTGFSTVALLACLALGTPACDKGGGDTHPGHEDEGRGAHAGEEVGEAHEAHGEALGHVKLAPEALERAGVRVKPVETGSLRDDVEATATVKHDVSRVAHISPLVEGQVVEVPTSLGDEVEVGQVVAVMRSVALGKARAAVQEARARVDVARSNFRRQRRLRKAGIASERSLVEAKGALREAEAGLEGAAARLETLGVKGGEGATYPLRSRIAGTVIEQHATLGEAKGPRDALFVVADDSEVWVVGRVYEKDIPKIHEGMKALVTLRAYPDRVWRGEIGWVGRSVDPDTRALPIRVTLDNPDGELRPGMFANIQLTSDDAGHTHPLVPVDAVQRVGGEEVVFVPGEEEGVFVPRPVELGVESGGLVEILEGLEPGRPVVTAGAFDLKAALTASGRSAAHQH
ncbi:MAG: efflux RND transporter periplasmic adaptor subunit [Myxococcota bacterium]